MSSQVTSFIRPSVFISSDIGTFSNSNSQKIEFAVQNLEDDSLKISYQCRLDDEDWVSCDSPVTYSSLPQGEHQFSVRVLDMRGEVVGSASSQWVVDLTPPFVSMSSKPNVVSNSVASLFGFEAHDFGGSKIKSFQCNVDNSGWKDCLFLESFILAPGSHNIQARAVDHAGNASAIETYSWIIDITPPIVDLVSGPTLITKELDAAFDFTVLDEGGGQIDSIICSLDGVLAPCSSPQLYEAVSMGTHTFEVYVTDTAGNVGRSAPYVWVIDRVAPLLSITSTPQFETNSTSATFVFSAVDFGGGTVMEYRCKLDNNVYAPCSSPQTYSSLGESEHNFSVIAVDTAGNESLVQSYTWNIDLTAPTLAILTPNIDGKLVPLNEMTNYSIVGSCSEEGRDVTLAGATNTTVLCSGGAWTTSIDVSGQDDGVLSLTAKQVDSAGNEGISSVRTLVKDTSGPQINITSAGPLRGNGNYGTLSWTLTEDHVAEGAHFSIDFYDGNSWGALGTVAATAGVNINKSYSFGLFAVPNVNTSQGKVRISLTDENGNATSVTSLDFIIDSAAPILNSVTINDGATYAGTSMLSVKIALIDNLSSAGFAVRLKEANGGTGDCQSEYSDDNWEPYTDNITNLTFIVAPTDGIKKVCVWAKDEVGNTSTISAPTTGVDGVNFDTILYQRGNPPLIASFSATATSDGSTDASIGQSVTISWSATDVEGLDNEPISFAYTTNNSLWQDIVTNGDISDQANVTWMGGLSGNPTVSGVKAFTTWTAPTSGYFRVRAMVRDISGNRSLPIQSQPFNLSSWSVYAGTTDRGAGGTSSSVALGASVAGSHFAVNPKNGDIYVVDEGQAIRKLDSKTGVVSTFIVNGANNFPAEGPLPANPRMAVAGYANLRFDSKGRLYLQEGDFYNSKIWQIDVAAKSVRLYAGGSSNSANNDGGIPATNLFLMATQFVFDEDDSLYTMTACAPIVYPYNQAKRLIKIAQNVDGTAGAVTRIIGNCSYANPTSGAAAYSQPAGANPYAMLSGLAVWDHGNVIYFAGYSSSVKYKIINGTVYSTNIGVDSVTSLYYNSSDQSLYVKANGLNKVTPNLNGADGDVAVQYLSVSGSGISCNEDNTDRLSFCGRLGHTFYAKNGLLYFVDGVAHNSFSTYRIRYVASDGKIKTFMGTMPLFGIGKDARLARGSFAGIYYKNSLEPNQAAFPEGLYFVESSGGVFGRINPVSRVIENFWGNQSRIPSVYANGDTVSSAKSMGAPYFGGDLMLLNFDNTGLPWLRWDLKLARLTESMQLDIKTVSQAYWHNAPDNGTDVSAYGLYVHGGKNNLTLKDQTLFLMGASYLQTGIIDPRVRIMAFDYAAGTTTKIMGGSAVYSQGRAVQGDVTVPGEVAQTDLWYGCGANTANCYSVYDANTDRLYISENSKIRFIHPATNPESATLTTVYSHPTGGRIHNLTVTPNSKQVWFMVGTNVLICKDISSGKSWCDGSTNHFALPGAAGFNILNAPNSFTWKDDSTLFVSDYLGQIWQYNVPP